MPTKKSQQKSFTKPKKIIVGTLLLLALAGAMYLLLLGYYQLQRYNNAIDQAELSPLREQLVRAIYSTKVNAPIEAKTGDIYFPQAKLFIPSTPTPRNLTYTYYEQERQLSITDVSVVEQRISELYGPNSSNFMELFDNLPRLQSCQRGFTITESSTLPDENATLQKSVTTDNGKTYFIYLANGCEELKLVLPVIETIKSY